MKIKRADDKPMRLHTKKKAKIHTHKTKGASIKGSNIYTVVRKPNASDVTHSNIGTGNKKGRIFYPSRYKRSTVHAVEKDKGIARFREAYRRSQSSIKVKDQKLHIAGVLGKEGAKAAADQIEGGQEVQQALGAAYELSRPVTGTTSRGAAVFRRKSAAERRKRIKKVEVGKRLARIASEKAATEEMKSAVKETTNISMRTSMPVVGRSGTSDSKAARNAMAKMERDDRVRTNRLRKIKFFLDKTKDEEHQQDSVLKLAKDLITRRISEWVQIHTGSIGMLILVGILGIFIITTPVIATVGLIYNSPFSVFMPTLNDGDTVPSVTSEYVAEFNDEIKRIADEHQGADEGEIVYSDYEGMQSTPSNYYDIIAVYMVKYGIGDTASDMNDTTKAWLKDVVDDMCSYSTSIETKEVDDGDGGTKSVRVLQVKVRLKTYRDMISEYGFDEDRVALLEEMMNPENLAMIGYTGGGTSGGGGGTSVCSLTEEQIEEILDGITDHTQKKVCSFALHRVGFPYSQALRDTGDYYDCSSLAYYSWKSAGVNISYEGATTAASEAKGLDKAGKTVSFSEMQPGDLIFYSYANNGRYKNISHVAIYVGNGMLVEAQNEQNGVVYREAKNSGSIVLIGRP